MPLLPLVLAGCAPQDAGFANGEDDVGGQTGEALAEISPTEIVWTDADVGYSTTAELTIRSIGDGDLTVYELSLLNDTTDSFVFDRVTDVTILPGEEERWPVTCDLEEAITAEANLKVRTNDPAQNEVLVPLSCTPG